ncbi:MAG: hypothetical protein ACM31I_10475 [Deltaproteobacteria bacterium]
MGTVKLRPQFHFTGERLPEGETAKLLVISRPAMVKDEFYPDGLCYMTPFSDRWGPLDLAAAWYEHEILVAEEAAAQFILSDPKRYFGSVNVEQVR